MARWPDVPPEERFWPKVRKAAPDECWEWTGAHMPAGYGMFWVKPRQRVAHRFAYELLVGPIPDGLQLDHLCRNRGCVNPAHLEPVTMAENISRGIVWNREKTHCDHGHEFTPANTYVYKDTGKRRCRACARRWMRERRIRAKERHSTLP